MTIRQSIALAPLTWLAFAAPSRGSPAQIRSSGKRLWCAPEPIRKTPPQRTGHPARPPPRSYPPRGTHQVPLRPKPKTRCPPRLRNSRECRAGAALRLQERSPLLRQAGVWQGRQRGYRLARTKSWWSVEPAETGAALRLRERSLLLLQAEVWRERHRGYRLARTKSWRWVEKAATTGSALRRLPPQARREAWRQGRECDDSSSFSTPPVTAKPGNSKPG